MHCALSVMSLRRCGAVIAFEYSHLTPGLWGHVLIRDLMRLSRSRVCKAENRWLTLAYSGAVERVRLVEFLLIGNSHSRPC